MDLNTVLIAAVTSVIVVVIIVLVILIYFLRVRKAKKTAAFQATRINWWPGTGE